MSYKVEEVNSGIFTCTLRASEIEKRVKEMADQGWKFESMEPVEGRCCLCFTRYKMIVVFSKE